MNFGLVRLPCFYIHFRIQKLSTCSPRLLSTRQITTIGVIQSHPTTQSEREAGMPDAKMNERYIYTKIIDTVIHTVTMSHGTSFTVISCRTVLYAQWFKS